MFGITGNLFSAAKFMTNDMKVCSRLSIAFPTLLRMPRDGNGGLMCIYLCSPQGTALTPGTI